jgi:hypothetical protein
MKYKIEFSGQAELLFAVMAKLLPDELHVHVEEIIDKPEPSPTKHRLEAPKSERRHIKAYTRITAGPNIDKGINKIIVGILSDGKPHKLADVRAALQESDYSVNSSSSRLQDLATHKYIYQPGPGLWQLTVATMDKIIKMRESA